MDTITHKQLDLQPLISNIQTVLELPENAVITPQQYEHTRNASCFIVVDLTKTTVIGTARLDFDGEVERETVSNCLLSTVSIDCYGNHSMQMCEKLRALLQSSFFQSVFKSMCCGLVSFSNIVDLSTSVGGSYEERGQMSITLSHTHKVSMPLYRINHSTQHINKD